MAARSPLLTRALKLFHRGQFVQKMKASSVPELTRMADKLRAAGIFGSPKVT